MLKDCLVLILGGGRGTRLFPLTAERSKPAIGFAGKYRLIDIPVSNCVNSGFNKIFVITQFLSASLHAHILHSYRFDNFSQGFVEILSAEQSHKQSRWFEGTADAVRAIRRHLRYMPQQHILILSGDHLYKMDYRKMLEFHLKKKAEVSIASVFVDAAEASRMGVLACDSTDRIKKVIEKPDNPRRLKVSPILQKKGEDNYLASMGIYLFNKQVLFDILDESDGADFGKNILPQLIRKRSKVYSYYFKGYWRDIGTVSSYYEESLNMLKEKPLYNVFDQNWPLFTRARFLPPSRIIDSQINSSVIADGCFLKRCHLDNSVVGLRSTIQDKTQIRDSVIMGNDYYEGLSSGKAIRPRIGKGVTIERAIIDKNVTIGDHCRLTDKRGFPDSDNDIYCIRDGITIIRRAVELPPHTVI